MKTRSIFGLTLQDTFFFLFLIGLSLGFYKVISPFLVSLFAAIVLSVSFYKLYLWLKARLTFKSKKLTELGRHVSSFSTVTVIALVIGLPLAVMTLLVSLEVADGYDNFRKSEFYGAFTSKSIVEKMKKLPLLHNQWHRLEELNLDQKLEQNVDTALQVIFQWTRKILVSTSTFFLQLLITLYLIYFFLLDGEKWGRRAYELLPIKNEDSDKIFFETMRVVQGALLGSVVVGVIEGAWGGLVFAAIGIPSPAIWGLVMTILSILPVVGSNTILIPFGLYMLATGHYGKAFVILVVGSGLITITTGLLKPKLVGDRAGLHPAMIVLSTLGGVAWLGMVGFFIGPLLAALFFMIWVQFSERYKKHLSKKRG